MQYHDPNMYKRQHHQNFIGGDRMDDQFENFNGKHKSDFSKGSTNMSEMNERHLYNAINNDDILDCADYEQYAHQNRHSNISGNSYVNRRMMPQHPVQQKYTYKETGMEGNKSLLNSSGNGKSHVSGYPPHMTSGISDVKPRPLNDLKFNSDINNHDALP